MAFHLPQAQLRAGEPPGNAAGGCSARSWSLPRIFIKAAQHHALDKRVQVFYELRRGRRRALIAQPRHLFDGGSFERVLACEYLIEYKAERVEIAFGRHFLTRELFAGDM